MDNIVKMEFWKILHNGEISYADDGELRFTPKGALYLAFLAWDDDKGKASELLINYCKFLVSKGYEKTTVQIWDEIKDKSGQEGVIWIDNTFNKYKISNDMLWNVVEK